jgi:hypothetical protein
VKGASDEVRQAMVAELGDDARFILRNPPPTEGSPIRAFSLDTAALSEKLREDRAAKIAERRKRLCLKLPKTEADHAQGQTISLGAVCPGRFSFLFVEPFGDKHKHT